MLEFEKFTKDELRTLLWMCQTTAARLALKEIDKNKKPSDNATYQRVIEISRKANAELIERNNAKRHSKRSANKFSI